MHLSIEIYMFILTPISSLPGQLPAQPQPLPIPPKRQLFQNKQTQSVHDEETNHTNNGGGE